MAKSPDHINIELKLAPHIEERFDRIERTLHAIANEIPFHSRRKILRILNEEEKPLFPPDNPFK